MDKLRRYEITDHVAEAVFLLFKTGESLLEPSVRLYIYQCVCLIHKASTDDDADACKNLTNNADLERQVQQEAANYMIAHKVLLNFPAIIVGLFCGAWSDVVGRRVPVLVTLVMTLIAVIMYLFSLLSTTDNQQPALALVLTAAAVRGAVGKSAILTMALYSYVCDTSPRQTRTQKIGRLLSMNYFGYFVGSVAAGGLLEVHGFWAIFAVVLVLMLICLVLTMRFMKAGSDKMAAAALSTEHSVEDMKQHQICANNTASAVANGNVDKTVDGDSSKETCATGGTVGKNLMSITQMTSPQQQQQSCFPFRLSHARDSIAVLIRSRPNRDRLHIVALFITLFIIQTCRSGEMDATLLFAERSPLSWKKSMYGYLLATDYAGLGLTTLVLLPLLIRCLRLEDMTMILLGTAFRIIRLVILASSSTTVGIYLSVVVGAPSSLIVSCGKALISKTIHVSETGKTFALMSCAEPVSNLVGAVIFTSVYQATFDWLYPGFVFALEVAFFLVFFAMLVGLWFDMRGSSVDQYNTLGEDLPTPGVPPASATAPLGLRELEPSAGFGYGTTSVERTCEGVERPQPTNGIEGHYRSRPLDMVKDLSSTDR